VLGPLLAEVMRARWSTEQLFLAAAVPALVSAVAMLSMRPAMTRRGEAPPAARLARAGDTPPAL
jgi:hypothetical protein